MSLLRGENEEEGEKKVILIQLFYMSPSKTPTQRRSISGLSSQQNISFQVCHVTKILTLTKLKTMQL